MTHDCCAWSWPTPPTCSYCNTVQRETFGEKLDFTSYQRRCFWILSPPVGMGRWGAAGRHEEPATGRATQHTHNITRNDEKLTNRISTPNIDSCHPVLSGVPDEKEKERKRVGERGRTVQYRGPVTGQHSPTMLPPSRDINICINSTSA